MIAATLTFANVTIDLLGHHVTRAGRRVSVRPMELRVMLRLCADAPNVVSKWDLATDVLGRPWDRQTNTLEVTVSRLREALGEPLGSYELIVSAPYGYHIPHAVRVSVLAGN